MSPICLYYLEFGLTDHRSVFYDMPETTHTHKSMMLRGAKPQPPVLTRSDIEITRGKASRAGRSHNGVPLGHQRNPVHYGGRGNRGHRGSDRGGRGNYRNDYQNHRQAPLPSWQPPPPGAPGFGFGVPPPPPPGISYEYNRDQHNDHHGGYRGHNSKDAVAGTVSSYPGYPSFGGPPPPAPASGRSNRSYQQGGYDRDRNRY